MTILTKSMVAATLPPVFLRIAQLAYREDLHLPPAKKSTDRASPSRTYPSQAIMKTGDGSEVVALDLRASHFNGLRAGDIFTIQGGNSRWADQNVLVEGYSYNYDRSPVVLWGRVVLRNGGLEREAYYRSRQANLALVKRSGEYDPLNDYGFDSVRRPEYLSGTLEHQQALLAQIETARQKPKISTAEPLPLEEVFHRFCTVLLSAETTDLLRRINTLFPIKERETLERELMHFKSPVQVAEFNQRLFAEPAALFESAYPEASLPRLLTAIEQNRQAVDYDAIFKSALNWIQTSLQHKIGLKVNLTIPEKNLPEAFPEILNDSTQQVIDYLAPLFDSDAKEEAADVCAPKPAYLLELVEKYGDPISAAKHVITVSLTAVCGTFERGYTYDFKHVVDQPEGIIKDPIQAARARTILLGASFDLDPLIQSLTEMFDEFGRQLEAIVDARVPISVSRSSLIGQVLAEIEAEAQTIAPLFAAFTAKLDSVAEATVAFCDVLSKPDFESSLAQAKKDIQDLMVKTDRKKDLLEMLKLAIDVLAAMPEIETVPLTNERPPYPLNRIECHGATAADCTETYYGYGAGDIIEYRNQHWLLEGYYKEAGRVTHVALRYISPDSGLNEHAHVDWIVLDHTTIIDDFILQHKWGDYDPQEYHFSPFARPHRHAKRSNQPHFDAVAGIRDKFLDPLVKLKREMSDQQAQSGTFLGSLILNKIMAQANQPQGKEIPLELRLMYHDHDIYTVFPFAPPSSSGKNVIRFELSTGCNWNYCTYCTLYAEEPFTLMDINGFIRHFGLIQEFLGATILASNFNRVFLSGGNGLIAPTEQLLSILGYIREHKGGTIKRTECYATTRAIKQHAADLRQLKRAGLDLVYWGVESGHDPVLKLVHKGYRSANVIEAGRLLRKAEIEASITIMPGLGGKKYANAHAQATAKLMGEILPRHLTLMATHAPGTPYDEALQAATDNRPLTQEEMIAQMLQIKDDYLKEARNNPLIRKYYTKIAAHSPAVTPASCNPTRFEVQI